jgi:drug/metabolite transporter (DMT)-like permease
LSEDNAPIAARCRPQYQGRTDRIPALKTPPMTRSPRIGIALAFVCLGILGAMPILSNARPAGFDGLTFAIWLTVWQLIAALPLFLLELPGQRRRAAAERGQGKPRIRTIAIGLATGAMFGLATYMYVVAAEKAGAISMIIALQAYPLFAILWEALFFGKRKSKAELGFTALMIAALVYLTTGGTFLVSGISWWSAFALGIPLLWSVAHILLRQVLVKTNVTPNQVTVSRLVVSGACLLLLHAAFGQPGALAAGLSDFSFQQAAFVMGVAYYLELILWFYAMRHIDVSVGSSVTVPAPAVTMLISTIVLGEAVETYQIVAMCVIALGMYGLLFAGRRAGRALSAE